MNLTIDRGEMVALVGLSGSGKTSLVSLILRFYDATDGTIQLHGADIKSLAPAHIRGQIATVPQEPALFSVSLHENIAYGMPDVSRAEVEAASRLSNAFDFVSAMPEGFDTVVGSRGITLRYVRYATLTTVHVRYAHHRTAVLTGAPHSRGLGTAGL
jgi:ABC-type multidrug transport system fused ATPase/permease subunit